MSKKRRLGFLAIAVLVLGLGGGGFLVIRHRVQPSIAAEDAASPDSLTTGERDGEDKVVRVPVEVAVAARHDLPAYFLATGSIEARRSVNLLAKAQGQVTKLLVEEGRTVRKGEVLLELDPREEEILLGRAKVNVANAERELDRIMNLSDKGLAADRDREQAEKARDLAIYDRELAQVRLDNKIIRAPFAGQVVERSVELGQTVNPGQPLVRLADLSPLEIRLYLPEQVVKDLHPGQAVEVRSDIDPDTPLAGVVDRVAPVVDPATSTVKVILRLSDELGKARVGSFARARITTDVHRDVVAIPKRALVPEAGANYLFVVEADTVRKVPVTTGYSDETLIEILDGIAPGERVVVVGQGGLRSGSKIRNLAERPAAGDKDRTAGVADADTN